MDIQVVDLHSDAKTKILAFCNHYIPIYEAKVRDKVRRTNLAELVNDMQKAIRNHFKERQQTILGRLEYAWKLKMESLSKTDWITAHIFDMDEEIAMLQDVLKEYYILSGTEGMKNAIKRMSVLTGVSLKFIGPAEFVEANAIKWGKKYAGTVSKTTEKAIRNQIATAIREGEGIGDVMKRIGDVYRAATGYRSEMIGRTEMGRAYNIAGAQQDVAMGVEQFECCIGCEPDCPECGPFQGSNPHTFDEMEEFEGEVHPNHVGSVAGIVPAGFVPNEVY